MKVTKIHFEQLFPTGNFANMRLGVEIEVDSNTESIFEAFQYAKKEVNECFEKLNFPNGGLGYMGYLQNSQGSISEAQHQSFHPEKLPERNLAHERLEIQIDNATSIEELKKLAVGLPESLEKYYDKRLQELKNQQ